MLTPDDIVHVRFGSTRLSAGYDQVEVDDLLDRAVGTLRGHLEGDGDAIVLLADDVAAASFTTTRFREGYAMLPVDDFLARLEATLRAHERRASGGSDAS